MTTTPRAHADLASEKVLPERLERFARPLSNHGNIAAPIGRAQRAMPLMRKVEIVYLNPRNEIVDGSRLVPAVPVFEDAFAAFARGTLLQTERGLVAIEDLWPGDRVRTVSNSFQTLLWRGSTMIVPHAQGQEVTMGRLTRIAADALGIARPMHDLVLGPRARLVYRAPGIRALTGKENALIPARDFIDGNNIIELTPPGAVPVYHIAFEAHECVIANGVEVESYNPGPAHAMGLRPDLVTLFLSCFPHLNSVEEFGLTAFPRLRLHDLGLFNVA